MQARFLLGPAGSGKTFRCLDGIRRALLDDPAGPPLLLLAPKQATFQLERQLLDHKWWGESPREPLAQAGDGSPGVSPHPLRGYTRLHIFSFDRLARFILEKLRLAPPAALNDEGRAMVLRALLLRHEKELKSFHKSARRPGFAPQLGQLMTEFQQHQFTPAKLRALAGRRAVSAELSVKLNDLALLLEKYSAWLAENSLQDSSHLLDAATQALLAPSTIHDSRFTVQQLWLDGFAEMTPQELDLLAAVLPHCGEATLAFCLDESGADLRAENHSWLSIWSVVRKSYGECHRRVAALPDCKIVPEPLKRDPAKSRFRNQPALAHLEQNWTSNTVHEPRITDHESVPRVIVCADPEAEATCAAREILRFVRAGGRFRDVAVLVRSLAPYRKPLERVFRRYDVPFFLDQRESVAHHPLAELTRSALRTVAFDWRHADWFAALKTGFAPADEAEIDALENEALARGWHGVKWHEPLRVAEDAALEKSVERLREKITPPFLELARALAFHQNKPNGGQLADALRDLWSALNVEQRLQSWSGDPRPALHATVFEQMKTWLANIALAFPKEAIGLRDWLSILEAGLAGLTVGVIPPALDQVLVGAIDRSRNPDLKLALVLGLNEGVFPAPPAAPVILTDADRDELGDQGSPLGANLFDRLARERFLGYIACTRASERLVATCSQLDANGKTLNPSPLISHLRRLFPGLTAESFAPAADLAGVEHANELATHPSLRIADFCAEIPALKPLAAALAGLRQPSPAEGLSPDLAEKLYGPTLRTSVSKLENFAACPFRFFIHAGLRADERQWFELDAREQGSFQHDALRIYHEQLRAEGRRWRDLTPPQARERIGLIANALALTFREGLLQTDAQTRFAARMLAVSLQDFLETITVWLRENYEFDPAEVEVSFGLAKDARPSPPWTLALGNGRSLALGGRIDRVDLWREPGGDRALAVVIDYKSSGKKLDAVLVAHGVQLQLLAYLNVLRRWKNPAERFGAGELSPAGVFYVSLRGRYERSDNRTDALADAAAARRAAYRHTGRFDAGALARLDRSGAETGEQFNYRRNKNGSLRKGAAEVLEHAAFIELLDGVEAQLRRMGNEIYSGAAAVDPYRKGTATACDYCACKPVCRIDPWTHRYRVLKKPDETEAEPV